MSDLGLTHIALVVRDLARSVQFYRIYAGMKVVHRRSTDAGGEVAWLSDLTRPFVVVLIESRDGGETPLGPLGHLGVAVASREVVDRLADAARREGILRSGPQDSGPIVGYWAFIADPDGNTLEVAYGQQVAFAVTAAGDPTSDASGREC